MKRLTEDVRILGLRNELVQKIEDGELSCPFDKDLQVDRLAIFTSKVFACHFSSGIDSRLPSVISSLPDELRSRFDVVEVIEAIVRTYPDLVNEYHHRVANMLSNTLHEVLYIYKNDVNSYLALQSLLEYVIDNEVPVDLYKNHLASLGQRMSRWDELPLNGKEKLEGFAQLLSALEFRKSEEGFAQLLSALEFRKSEEGIYSKEYLSVVLGQNEDAKEDVESSWGKWILRMNLSSSRQISNNHLIL